MGSHTFNSTKSKVRVTSKKPVILWFRQDLRLFDQPALVAACKSGAPIIPLYIYDQEIAKEHKIGGASLWWLHKSLESLGASLKSLGLRLVLRKGNSVDVIDDLVKHTGATEIHGIKHYEPWWREQEELVEKSHKLYLHDGNQLMPPGSVTTGAGKPFKIYTPFWRALLKHMPPEKPLPCPKDVEAPEVWPESDSLESWGLLPRHPNWARGFESRWEPGEGGARHKLDRFSKLVKNYENERDYPSKRGTSELSPHLHYGEISPRVIWHQVADKSSSVHTFLNEIGWRDYAQNILLLYPEIGWRNSKTQYDNMPWRTDDESKQDFKKWCEGKTGYPIVDAGMRQLWATGWMHNRVRMITASFLVKHLLIDWREGEKWFWDCLVDADYGSNSVAWQWTAGCGIDSNMWSRIMAPLTQSKKFDSGEYIREWVAELKDVDLDDIHDPDDGLRDQLGYPRKLVEHKDGRERALDAYEAIRK